MRFAHRLASPALLLAVSLLAALPAAAKPRPPAAADESMRHLVKDIVCKGQRCVLKNGVVDRALADQALLMRSCRVVPMVNEGKVAGLKLFAMTPGTLFYVLGLRNGDLLHTVGGYDLALPEKALEAYAALRAMHTVDVVLERAGQPLTFTYQIEPAKTPMR